MISSQREALYRLIDEACTNGPIRALLREKKLADRRVRIGGDRTEILAQLRTAHGNGVISDADLISLLSTGEENGRQHLFLFRTRSAFKSQYELVDDVRRRLLKKLGNAAIGIPRVALEPKERLLADVRVDTRAKGGSDLVVKTYSGRTVERFDREHAYEQNGQRYIDRTVKVIDVRLVSLVRLRSAGLLEIRVPTGDVESRRFCLGELAEMQQLVSGAIVDDHFAPLQLNNAMRRLVAEQGSADCGYRLGPAVALDEGAPAEFSPAMEGLDLFKCERHVSAIAQYDDFGKLDVHFDSQSVGGRVGKELRCQIGVYLPHGIRLGARMAPAEVDGIVSRLWRLSR